MDEYEGKSVFDNLVTTETMDPEKKKKQMKNKLAQEEPKLSFTIENKSLKILHCSVEEITIKYYLIDIEILFSRTPFIKQSGDDFSFVIPNFTQTLQINKGTNIIEQLESVPISDDFSTKNIFIEVSSKTLKKFDTYFSTTLNVLFRIIPSSICSAKYSPFFLDVVPSIAKGNTLTVVDGLIEKVE